MRRLHARPRSTSVRSSRCRLPLPPRSTSPPRWTSLRSAPRSAIVTAAACPEVGPRSSSESATRGRESSSSAKGPGATRTARASPSSAAAGQLLTDIIEKGMRLARADVYICNVVKCRPPENRNPEPDEVAACCAVPRPSDRARRTRGDRRARQVRRADACSQTKTPITRLRGRWTEYRGIPLMPTLHPAYLLRNPGDKKLVWQDIKQVMARLGMRREDSAAVRPLTSALRAAALRALLATPRQRGGRRGEPSATPGRARQSDSHRRHRSIRRPRTISEDGSRSLARATAPRRW